MRKSRITDSDGEPINNMYSSGATNTAVLTQGVRGELVKIDAGRWRKDPWFRDFIELDFSNLDQVLVKLKEYLVNNTITKENGDGLDSLFRENKLIVSEARYTNLNKKFCGNGRTTDKSNRTKENKDEWALYLINKIISHDLIQYGKEFINIITIPLIEERERVCNSSE